MKNKKGFSLVVVIFSFITMVALAALVVDTAIISNQRTELQKAVEMTALSVASTITLEKNASDIFQYPDEADIRALIEPTFNMVKDPNLLEHASIVDKNTSVNQKSRAVKVYAQMPARTYFASILGFGVINLKAQAAAITMPEFLKKSATLDYRPQDPLGIASYANNEDNILGAQDKKIVSLGPGGHIELDLDTMLVDAKGPDLLIKETGHKDGYFVFAGIKDRTGQTTWVNISCTGIPIGANYQSSEVGAYNADIPSIGTNTAKFYGAGLFDLGYGCDNNEYIGNLKYANKLIIIDDNEEDGFMYENYFPSEDPKLTLLLGEHSSITPGADIDSVEVLNHSKLIPVKEYEKDTDEDGLIDYIERAIGTINNPGENADGDSHNDEAEYSGWRFQQEYNSSDGALYFTSPSLDDGSGVIIN